MTDDRLSVLLRISREALEREGAERSAYLDSACAGDAALRREVETLLAEPAAGTPSLLDTPPWAPPPLAAGHRLGPYEVLGALGAGGMGTVYRARDTRLGRRVAIKVLSGASAIDPADRDRFTHEARAVAALNHPHICTLHDTGRDEGIDYFVMEELEGETLATRLEKARGRRAVSSGSAGATPPRPLPLTEALTIAAQIADALAAAHQQGIVHRDLKPANVMLTTGSGIGGAPRVKLLDFGLAKFARTPAWPASGLSVASSEQPRTTPGLVMGTVPYMAPEQLEGKEVDARADIFSFGCVLYEMLSGRRALAGDSGASVVSAIMTSEPPPLRTLQPDTPAVLERVTKRCLEKDPAQRFSSGHDLALALEVASGPGDAVPVAEPTKRLAVPVVVAAGIALTLGVVGAGVGWLSRPGPTYPVGLSLSARPADEVNAGGHHASIRTAGGSATALAWTPDGQALVFVGRKSGVQQLYVRHLDAAEARPLAGTEGAQMPAVSADGQWIGFWAGGTLRKIPIGGGPIQDLMTGLDLPPKGLAWGGSSELFVVSWLHTRTELWTVPATGGTPRQVTLAVGDGWARLPFVLPGGRALLYTVRKRIWTWGDEQVVVQPLPAGQPRVLLTDAADARYLPTGHLVFLRRGTLWAVPFDLDRLEVSGPAVAMLESVAQSLSSYHSYDINGAGQFAVSSNGMLAWLPATEVALPARELVTVDRTGKAVLLPMARRVDPALELQDVHISPDGRHLFVGTEDPREMNVWIYNLADGRVRPAIHDGEAQWPAWSPDGRLFFNWLESGRRSLAFVPGDTDGTIPPQSLESGQDFIWPATFTPDGRLIAVRNDREIVVVTFGSGQLRIESVHEASRAEAWPALSADGQWLAYGASLTDRTDPTIQPDVYVRHFPGAGPALPVSTGGGRNPVWNPNGRELLYVTTPDQGNRVWLMAVDFAPGSPPVRGTPRPLFELTNSALSFGGDPLFSFCIAPDGQHFYTTRQLGTPTLQQRVPPVTHINLIPNWIQELKEKAPARK